MSNVPTDLKYTKDHEWVRQVEGRIVVGITDHAQNQLSDIVFVEMPRVGHTLEEGSPFGTVESVKSVSEMFAPVSGKVVRINEDVQGEPELLNTDPYGDGWIVELQPSDPKQLNGLMSAAEYEKYIQQEG